MANLFHNNFGGQIQQNNDPYLMSTTHTPPRKRGPQPEQVLICDFCRHEWQDHMDLAVHDEPISFEICARLLMVQGAPAASPAAAIFQGSPGPGPMGPPGVNGLQGPQGRDGRGVAGAYLTVDKDGGKHLNFNMTDGTTMTAGRVS